MRKLYDEEEKVCDDEMMKLIEKCGLHIRDDVKIMYYAIIEDETEIIAAGYDGDRFSLIDRICHEAIGLINQTGRKLTQEGLAIPRMYRMHPEVQLFRMMRGDKTCLIKVDDFDIRILAKNLPMIPRIKFVIRSEIMNHREKIEIGVWKFGRIRRKGYCIADPIHKMTTLQVHDRINELKEQHPDIEFHFDGDEKMILGKVKEDNIEGELKQWDIAIRHDLFYDDENDTETGKYFLMTTDDPSVDIFGVQVSPEYDDIEMLKKWWKANKKRIIEELEKDDPDWKKIDFTLRK